MLEALTAIGVTLLGGTLGGLAATAETEAAGGDAEADALAETEARTALPLPLPEAGPGVAGGGVTLPDMVAQEARFDRFDPEIDQVVVVYPDAMGAAGIADLSFDYDEARDETRVTLHTPDGPKPVCCLSEVAPGEMDAGNFGFMSAAEAAATLGPLSQPATDGIA
ncbi:hypothetical protein SAMN05421759_101277 [Roseivivax lentus]|uniref:Uncharacterized protein n=1 Tax=Roseivivax lentus TaxID=633194 RepID=A0A1N7JWN2_9RHOB|nr:hypothetical protein [Roseivivax lentus]SIS53646.1 hypothetical protein SAMN05421759_101277 [Roseivivax lentus]